MSVGEGDERHLILERCPETSMYVKTQKSIIYYFLWEKIQFLCISLVCSWVYEPLRYDQVDIRIYSCIVYELTGHKDILLYSI